MGRARCVCLCAAKGFPSPARGGRGEGECMTDRKLKQPKIIGTWDWLTGINGFMEYKVKTYSLPVFKNSCRTGAVTLWPVVETKVTVPGANSSVRTFSKPAEIFTTPWM